jgi:hypothetical protein
MADQNPRIHVSTAARRKADDDPHDFAAIKIRYRTLIDIRAAALRRQSRNCRAEEQENNQCRYRNPQFLTPPTCAAMYHESWATIFIPTNFQKQLRFPSVQVGFCADAVCRALQIDARLL